MKQSARSIAVPIAATATGEYLWFTVAIVCTIFFGIVLIVGVDLYLGPRKSRRRKIQKPKALSSESGDNRRDSDQNNKPIRDGLIQDSRMYQAVVQGTRDISTRTRIGSYCGWYRQKVENIHLARALNRPSHSNEHFLNYSNRGLCNVPANFAHICMHINGIIVDASYNRLTGLPDIISSIPSCRNLQILDLSGNSIRDFPRVLLGLTSLKILQLGNNQITVLPSEISYLSQVTELGLGYNLLSCLPISLFGIVTLEVLTLCGNELTSIPPEVCQALSLKCLDLSKCGLKFIPPTIGRCQSLEVLRLAHNLLEDIPSELAQLRRLRVLDIDANHLVYLPSALLFCGNLSIDGYCKTFWIGSFLDGWKLINTVPEHNKVKNPQPLTHLAKCAVKEHGLRIDPLPYMMQEVFMELHNCIICGHRGMPQYVRMVRKELFGSRFLPFSYMVCQKHVTYSDSYDIWLLHLHMLMKDYSQHVLSRLT